LKAVQLGWLIKRALFVLGSLCVLAIAGLAANNEPALADTTYVAQMGGGGRGVSVDLFRPSTIFVNVGDTVKWNNPYDEGHSVTFLADKPAPTGAAVNNPIGANPASFDGSAQISSGIMNKDQAYTVTFSKEGQYKFICVRHTSQTGLVQVLPAGVHVPDQKQLDSEAATSLDQGINIGLKAAAEVPAPTKTTSANGATTWSIPNSPIVPIQNGQATSMQFLPSRLQVNLGDTVEWNNTTTTPHTVTFLGGGAARAPGDVLAPPQGIYDGKSYVNSGTMGTQATFTGGTKFSLTFAQPGTYTYICILHVSQGMAGVIEVGARGPAAGITPPSTGDGGLRSGQP
jgi:plastocyanin